MAPLSQAKFSSPEGRRLFVSKPTPSPPDLDMFGFVVTGAGRVWITTGSQADGSFAPDRLQRGSKAVGNGGPVAGCGTRVIGGNAAPTSVIDVACRMCEFDHPDEAGEAQPLASRLFTALAVVSCGRNSLATPHGFEP